MTVCKCGRKFKDDMLRPINCACGSTIVLRTESDIIGVQSHIIAADTPSLWLELHTYIYINSEKAAEFYLDWQSRIPNFGCACKEHWANIVKELPPNFNSAREFFEWGVAAHNLVNNKLGYEHFPYEVARALYKKDCV